MSSIHIFIVTTLVSLSSLVPCGAVPSTSQIIAEMGALQANPDTGMRQRLFSKIDFLVVTGDRMPNLYGMVSNLAGKLGISVPQILIYTGYDADLSNGAAGLSLYHNCGTIFIGKKLIGQLSGGELEAVIAHELSHIACNHGPVTVPLVVLGKVIGMIPIVNKMHEKYVAAFNALMCNFEVQADLSAVGIIDNPQMLCDALNRTPSMIGPDHPSDEERKRYILVAAQQKLKA